MRIILSTDIHADQHGHLH